MIEELSKSQNLETDIDLRLIGLMTSAAEVPEWNWELIVPFLRTAYADGYCHALAEPVRGELCLTHDYYVPQPGDKS